MYSYNILLNLKFPSAKDNIDISNKLNNIKFFVASESPIINGNKY